MAEPSTRADRIDFLFPWLLHWTIADERIGGFRSDAFAVESPGGLVVIDPLPLEEPLQKKLKSVAGIVLTHGNHQRSAWRFRRELGAPVHAPSGAAGLDEDPDVWFDARTALPGGLQAVEAAGFDAARYLTFTHADGTGVLFCGDLICQDPDGPYRFPVQPGYFDPPGGMADARRLLDLPTTVLCAAHAEPCRSGCREALQGALDRAATAG
jgi:glyoxylase-like metal-dependent hydrolase (beta-lactamase superfamily II)